jgi:hypothetical protein
MYVLETESRTRNPSITSNIKTAKIIFSRKLFLARNMKEHDSWQYGYYCWRMHLPAGLLSKLNQRLILSTGTSRFHGLKYYLKLNWTSWPYSSNELYRPSDRCLSAKLVPNFAGTACCMVSATNSHGHYSGFSRPEPLLFHSSSSSIVLTRLSGPCSRPPTSQKNLVEPGIEPGTSVSVATNSDH